MSEEGKTGSRVRLAISLVAACALGWILVGQQSSLNAAQPSSLDAAEQGLQDLFMGGIPSFESAEEVNTSRILFPAGVRSNWHTHTWGQLLMVEEGEGRTQVRGGQVLSARPGEPWFTAAGVEHWHGAAPDEDALQLTIYEGGVEWLEPVQDEEYLVTPQR